MISIQSSPIFKCIPNDSPLLRQCDDNPCGSGGKCKITPIGYKCICGPGNFFIYFLVIIMMLISYYRIRISCWNLSRYKWMRDERFKMFRWCNLRKQWWWLHLQMPIWIWWCDQVSFRYPPYSRVYYLPYINNTVSIEVSI